MLERGDLELIEYFLDKCNRQLVQDLNAMEEELKEMRIREIKTAVKIRLEMLQPYVNVWPQALAILAQPRNVPGAVSKMAKMVDDIWIVAGDTSEDYNWYTKRGLLAGLYSSTELYMLTDTSPHFEDTWKFLDRRIEDIMVAVVAGHHEPLDAFRLLGDGIRRDRGVVRLDADVGLFHQ
eukprot:jgi/Pico_ML_1/53469/g4006.t1